MLVLTSQVGARQFICPDDNLADRTSAAATDKSGNYFDGFQNPRQLSYSLAYPWNADAKPGAWWHNTCDANLPIIADMTPKQGTGTPTRDLTPPSAPSNNTTWNSTNHNGIGQNIGYADGHADFQRMPACGHNNDNIYSMSASPSKGPAQFGGIPAGNAPPVLQATEPPYDILMLPVRNATTGAM